MYNFQAFQNDFDFKCHLLLVLASLQYLPFLFLLFSFFFLVFEN